MRRLTIALVTAALLVGALFIDLGSQGESLTETEEKVPERLEARPETLPSASVEQRRITPSVPSAQESPEFKPGGVCVTLVGPDQRPVQHGRICILRATELHQQADVDPATGQVRISLEPGTYQARVLPESLEPGYLPPRDQIREASSAEFGRVEVREEQYEHVTLTLERACRIHGYIRDEHGDPIEWVHARADHAGPSGKRTKTFYFDASPDGYYEGYLYPGSWIISASIGVSREHPYDIRALSSSTHPLRDLVRPLPQARRLHPGAVEQIDFLFGGGSASLSGTVLDEQGGARQGLTISLNPVAVAEPSTGTVRELGMSQSVAGRDTDQAGCFHLDGVAPGWYELHIEPEGYQPMAAPGESTVGELQQPRKLLIRGAESIELVVPRPDPVRVEGRVLLDPGWAQETNARPSGLFAVVRLPSGARRSRDRRQAILLSADGSFVFHVGSHEGIGYLEISHGETVLEVPVRLPAPSPDEGKRIQLPVRFPE